jgi:hypothetical protein
MRLARISTLLLALLGVAILPLASAHAQEPAATADPSALVGSPFTVTSSLDVGAAALRYCDAPTQSVCNAACECLFPGADGAYCIADPVLTCRIPTVRTSAVGIGPSDLFADCVMSDA